jgi:hypothetical protein
VERQSIKKRAVYRACLPSGLPYAPHAPPCLQYKQVYCILRLDKTPFARTLVHTESRGGPGTFYWDEKFSFLYVEVFMVVCVCILVEVRRRGLM